MATTTIYTNADTMVRSDYPTTNYGTATTLYLNRRTTTGYDRILIGFDVSALSGTTINSATLYFYSSYFSGTVFTCYLHRNTGSWNETAVTWNTQPGVAAASASVSITGTGWFALDAASVVRDWIENGQPNYGVALRGDEATASVYANIIAREYGSSYAYLVVDYSLAGRNFQVVVLG